MRRFFHRCNPRAEDGQVLAFFAVSVSVLLLGAAMVIDPSNAFVGKQKLQNIADAAALGAAGDLSSSGNYSDSYIAQRVNFWSSANHGPTGMRNCSASSPPCYSWPYTGDQNKIEVKLVSSTTNFFGNLYGLTSTAVHGRAVGVVGHGPPPPYTFLSLNSSCDNHTLKIASGGQLTVDNNIYTNSQNGNPNPPCSDGNAHDAFDVFNAGGCNANCGFISAPGIFVAGGWETHAGVGSVRVGGIQCADINDSQYPNHNPSSTANPPPAGCPWINQPPVSDPFAGRIASPSLGNPACAGATTYPTSSYTPPQYLDGSISASSGTLVDTGSALQVGDMVQVDSERMSVTNVVPGPGSDTTISVTRGVTGTTAAAHSEASYTVSDMDRAGNTATLATAANTLAKGNEVRVSGVDLSSSDAFPFNGLQSVTAATATSVSYADSGDTLPPYITITNEQVTGNVATLTTSVPSGFAVGDSVYLNGVKPAIPDNTYVVTAKPSPTTFSFALTHANVPSQAANGNVGFRVTNEQITTNVATLTTASPHHLNLGDHVYINGVANIANGDYAVTAATSTTFSFAFTHANVSSTAVNAGLAWGRTITGTVTGLTEIKLVTPTTTGTASTPAPCAIAPGGAPKTLNPGTYYGGICIGLASGTPCTDANCAKANATKPKGGDPNVAFTSGTYVMAGGGLYICGGATVSAPNVMIYNTVDPTSSSGAGALGQVEVYTTGSATLGPQTGGAYAGMTIFQDPGQEIDGADKCDAHTQAQTDIVLAASSNGLGGISGTIYAADQRAQFTDNISGTANLAVLTGCILINGATSEFKFQASGLFGVGATLGG